MRTVHSPPSIVPSYDMTAYIVLDDFGKSGRAFRETDVEQCDSETVIANIIRGDYNCPERVIAFNTADNWSSDVTEGVAQEIFERAKAGQTISPSAREFVERQLQETLPLHAN